jgi:hypothetical protein
MGMFVYACDSNKKAPERAERPMEAFMFLPDPCPSYSPMRVSGAG